MISRSSEAVEVRQATEKDMALSFAVTEDAIRPYVEATWGGWDQALQQRKRDRGIICALGHWIVLADGEVAGIVAAELEPSHVRLDKLYLKTSARGKGIGALVLSSLLKAAEEAVAQPLRLRRKCLPSTSGLQAFYLRHGFHETSRPPERVFMEAKPKFANKRMSSRVNLPAERQVVPSTPPRMQTPAVRVAGVVLRRSEVLLHRRRDESVWATRLAAASRTRWISCGQPWFARSARRLACASVCGKLVYVAENFFPHAGAFIHEVGLYFHLTLEADSAPVRAESAFPGAEAELEFKWFERQRLSEVNLRPSFLVRALASAELEFRHVVEHPAAGV